MKDSSGKFKETFHLGNPKSVQEARSPLESILDAKYEKVDLRKVAESANNLNKANCNMLHAILEEYSNLFDGTLGKWKLGAYDKELRPEAAPYHAQVFPITKAYTNTLKLKVKRLEKAGELKRSIIPSGQHPYLSPVKRMVL